MRYASLKIFIFGAVLFIATLGYSTLSTFAQGRSVHVITLDEATINPATADYIMSAIDDAVSEGAECLIIQLDTPGGLLTSTRSIVKKIMTADLPVIVYIAPGGSRAGSAGVFITYASHVAAMAPSTNIGAAHPVQMGGGQPKKGDQWKELKELLDRSQRDDRDKRRKSKRTDKDKEEIVPDENPMNSKILQDTVAFIRAIANERNRNEQWAVESVTKSLSIPETDALKLGVVEIVADNLNDLLNQLDGRTVMVKDQKITLNTQGAVIESRQMDFRQQFLNTLANPNIAYIFMILGFYGLLYEITHPGIGVPGVMGAIFLILAFYSMQTLPTNYAGVALILLSVILFVAEAMAPGIGLLALGGLVCMILGSLILFDSPVPVLRVSNSLIIAFSASTAAITIFLVRMVLKAHHKKAHGGKEGLIGEVGTARVDFNAGTEGKVFVHGEIWNATADEDIHHDERIEVVDMEGMVLKVKSVNS